MSCYCHGNKQLFLSLCWCLMASSEVEKWQSKASRLTMENCHQASHMYWSVGTPHARIICGLMYVEFAGSQGVRWGRRAKSCVTQHTEYSQEAILASQSLHVTQQQHLEHGILKLGVSPWVCTCQCPTPPHRMQLVCLGASAAGTAEILAEHLFQPGSELLNSLALLSSMSLICRCFWHNQWAFGFSCA